VNAFRGAAKNCSSFFVLEPSKRNPLF